MPDGAFLASLLSSALLLPGGVAAAPEPASRAQEDWERGNRLPAFDLARRGANGLPEGWEVVCPNPALAPVFGAEDGPGGTALTAEGNGRTECFGYLRHPVRLDALKTYRLRVRFRAEGLDDINRHLLHAVFAEGFNDGIFTYHRAPDGAVLGDSRFPGPAAAVDGELRLVFRFSPHGRVRWEAISLQECEPIPPRRVTVACASGRGDLGHWGRWLDLAGQRKVDLALLPEMLNGKPVAEPEPLDGPTGRFLAEKARQWRMYVSGSFYERRGDLTLNTAPLFDRAGRLVGSYSKNQLYDPEETAGATPGVGFPVFDTDFGKVGIVICYDSWFPEPMRLLAYQGAELVLLPNAGYYTALMPARAADNGVWIAVSSLNGPAGVWDSGGARAGEAEPDPTRFVASSITACERDEANGLLVVTMDLSRRYSPHWWGGPMLSAPGGRRVRQTLIEPLEEPIAREAQRWCEP